MFAEQVDHLDKLLDELEDLARSDLPSSRFFAAVVDRLRLTMAAESVVLLLPAASGDWLPIASSGVPSAVAQAELARRATASAALTAEFLMGSEAGEHWIATPLRAKNFAKGCLLAGTGEAIPKNAIAGFVELLAAFSEVIAIRQQSELESFLDETWDHAQAVCHQINLAKSQDEASALLAGGLARTLGAARVTVMTAGWLGRPQVLALSGVPQANSRAAAVQALQNVGAEVVKSGKPVLRQQAGLLDAQGQPLPEIAADGTFNNLIGVRLSSSDNQTQNSVRAGSTLLAIEYQTYPEMVRSATKLSHLLPTVGVAWEQHSRWLRLPRILQLWMLGPMQALRGALSLLKWAALLAIVVLALIVLRTPYPLVIEAEGAYEPVTSRAIYAADDGFIEELLVDDGNCVKAGEPLVQMRSPALELRIEQTHGAARAVDEEASGIRIAINQLSGDAPDILSNQSRLAGKIAELEVRKESLQQQLQLLEQQRTRLLLKAPIDGWVVAKDLRRNLAGRPVRRGDSLFTIVDQSGLWHVRVQVADRDVGYLLRHFSGAESHALTPTSNSTSTHPSAPNTNSRSNIEFCLASDPDERFTAEVTWIADQVENRHGEGCSVEVRATVGTDFPPNAHAGAGVHAFFECGQQPLWFVWCRPLVEAAQRRMWFSSQDEE